LEVTLTAGIPYSQLVNQPARPRPFEITVEVIHRDRDELRWRIDTRVTQMLEEGLEEEAASVFHLRHLNTLNTVGYKEFFALWEAKGEPFVLTEVQREAVATAIKLNTWHYAKKQLTWLKKKA
jgi:tRNA dimethylallyltransferase